MAAGFAGIGVKVVAELAADLDFVAGDGFQRIAEERFGPAVAVGVAVVEEGDALIVGEIA